MSDAPDAARVATDGLLRDLDAIIAKLDYSPAEPPILVECRNRLKSEKSRADRAEAMLKWVTKQPVTCVRDCLGGEPECACGYAQWHAAVTDFFKEAPDAD